MFADNHIGKGGRGHGQIGVWLRQKIKSLNDLTKSLDDLTKSLNDLTKSLNDLTKSLNDLTKSLKDFSFVIAMAAIYPLPSPSSSICSI